MHLPSLLLLLTTSLSVLAVCTVGFHTYRDCCWGSDDPVKACIKQTRKGTFIQDAEEECKELEFPNFCSNKKNDNNETITAKMCSADCCFVSSGWGRSCPKPTKSMTVDD